MRKRTIAALVGVAVVGVITTAAVVGGTSTRTAVQAGHAVTATAPVTVHSTKAAPAATTPTPSDPVATQAAPELTAAQEQAVSSARSYLSDGQGFSRLGLLNQLTSSSGEGFAEKDAEFAVAYLSPDWNAQAVTSARNYLADGQGFSHASLYQQLTSSAGEKFTAAQASYALKKVGL